MDYEEYRKLSKEDEVEKLERKIRELDVTIREKDLLIFQAELVIFDQPELFLTSSHHDVRTFAEYVMKLSGPERERVMEYVKERKRSKYG